MQPLINGQAYSWSQITLNVLGVQVAGFEAISYEENQEMVDNYGGGNRPVSRGLGRIETTGSVTLHMEEVEALQTAAPNRRLQAIPEFDIVVAFLPDNGNIVIHTLKNCRFKTNKRDMTEGDTKVAVEIELQISHINW